MWAYRLTSPGHLELVETSAPTAAALHDGHVLLRILAGGVCGSDVPKFHGRAPASHPGRAVKMPGPMGYPLHEVVGEVVASRHDATPVGTRVVGWAAQSNGLAEYVITPGERVAPFNPSLDPVTAVLIQSVACILHALDRVEVAGERIAIIGLGPIGLLFGHVAATRGAKVIGVDPVNREKVAAACGFDVAVQATSHRWVRDLTDAERPTICIEAVGHQTDTLNHALHATHPGGTVLHFGIPDQPIYPVDVERLMRAHLTLIGGVTREHRSALTAADDYVARHPELHPTLISHVLGRSHAQRALGLAASASADRIKVLLDLA